MAADFKGIKAVAWSAIFVFLAIRVIGHSPFGNGGVGGNYRREHIS